MAVTNRFDYKIGETYVRKTNNGGYQGKCVYAGEDQFITITGRRWARYFPKPSFVTPDGTVISTSRKVLYARKVYTPYLEDKLTSW